MDPQLIVPEGQPNAADPNPANQPVVVTPPPPPTAAVDNTVVSPDVQAMATIEVAPAATVAAAPIKTVAPPPTQPLPIIVGQNSPEFKAVGTRRRAIFGLFVGILAVVGLGIGSVVYFWLLPSDHGTTYQTNIKAAYASQSDKMVAVYDSFNRPAFTADHRVLTQNQDDYNNASAAIKSAQNATDNLAESDHLNILPGASLLGAGKAAVKEHKAMQDYINQSKTMLDNYATLVTFLDKFQNLTEVQAPLVGQELAQLDNPKDVNQILPNAQAALTILQQYHDALNALSVPIDLKPIVGDYNDSIAQLQTGLGDIVNAISTNNGSQAIQGLDNLVTAVERENSLSNESLVQPIQHGILKTEIDQLKTADPIP